jgi:hypothetical protein
VRWSVSCCCPESLIAGFEGRRVGCSSGNKEISFQRAFLVDSTPCLRRCVRSLHRKTVREGGVANAPGGVPPSSTGMSIPPNPRPSALTVHAIVGARLTAAILVRLC